MELFLRTKNIVITIMNVIQPMTNQLFKLAQTDWHLQVKAVVWQQTVTILTESLVLMELALWDVSIDGWQLFIELFFTHWKITNN